MCADGIIDSIGFSYDPEVFQAKGMATFNWYWQDLTCPTNELTLIICQNIHRFDKMGKRIFVHCHAGAGRTCLVIASYLYYSGMIPSGSEAVQRVKEQRYGSLKKKAQCVFVVNFCEWLDTLRESIFPLKTQTGSRTQMSYSEMMAINEKLCHGIDS